MVATGTKVSRELLHESINALLDESARRHRKFTETVEMQIALKNINPHKDKPASGTFRVRHCMKPNFRVCVIGDPQHCDEAKAKKVDCIDMETIRLMRKKSSIAKKIMWTTFAFIATYTSSQVLWLAVCVGHVKMTTEMLSDNVNEAIRSLLTLLKKNWQNIRSIHLKSTMGRPQRIY
ncbi:hypothetical protein HPB51_024055 [Rhipicephalus microplus]|uniref:Uncharacterized protein n=1 Tax=Rhipicephalus microplus TaxID=6941 RepID=A0A9J6ED35_RHIMP|nr:hypothetical protein HPB51_024055 [Rhipicephalus microplus]